MVEKSKKCQFVTWLILAVAIINWGWMTLTRAKSVTDDLYTQILYAKLIAVVSVASMLMVGEAIAMYAHRFKRNSITTWTWGISASMVWLVGAILTRIIDCYVMFLFALVMTGIALIEHKRPKREWLLRDYVPSQQRTIFSGIMIIALGAAYFAVVLGVSAGSFVDTGMFYKDSLNPHPHFDMAMFMEYVGIPAIAPLICIVLIVLGGWFMIYASNKGKRNIFSWVANIFAALLSVAALENNYILLLIIFFGTILFTLLGLIKTKKERTAEQAYYADFAAVKEKAFKQTAAYKQQQVINSQNNVEKLKQLKELFDDGAITQAEFDEKKKELL